MPRIALLLLLVVAAIGAAPLSGQAERGAKPDGRLVFLAPGNRFVSIDVATGRRTVRRVPDLPPCAPELFTTGGHVVFSAVRKQRTVVYSIPASLDRPPRRLGTAHAFVPSATEGRVWLAGVDCDRSRMVGVREVSVDGEVTSRSRRRLPDGWLQAAVGRGLLIRGKHALIWNPSTGRSRRISGLRGVFASHGHLLAGCTLAPRCGKLAFLDTTTSRRTPLRQPAGRRLDFYARFSPNGSMLAATAGAERRWSVALIDPSDGSARIVPGSSTGRTYPQLTWASSGWLFFRGRGNRIMAYRPGEPRAVELPFRWPHRALSFIGG